MNEKTQIVNERAAESAFDKQSSLFDDLYTAGTIIKYKRERVRDHILSYLKPHSHILELNAGTGEDAVYFARQGHFVHATDISEGMQKTLIRKIKQHQLDDKVTYEKCSFTALQDLKNKGPYDLIFSNLAGLNCTDKLTKVLDKLPSLLKPKGVITLVFLPKFCLWEFLLLFKGKFKTATRRLFASGGATAYIEGVSFKCWYYSPSSVIKYLSNSFDLLCMEGLCTIIPPSYIEDFAEKHPKLYMFLQLKENKLKSKWPWKFIGDYVLLSFRKKG